MQTPPRPSEFRDALRAVIADAARRADINAGNADAAETPAALEKPRDPAHGDFCSPIAMTLAKRVGAPPRKLAQAIVAAMRPPDWLESAQVAGAGFVNLFLRKTAKTAIVAEILARGEDFGARPPRREAMLLEFVSANPTGPLHVGHGRACAYGDSLANILECRGYDVRREYYVNDAGRQMRILTASVWMRHWRGASAELPPGAYQGGYLTAIAAQLADAFAAADPPAPELESAMRKATDPDAAADCLVAAALAAMPAADFAAAQRQVRDVMLETVIKPDMRSLGLKVGDIAFFYESALREDGRVDNALAQLRDAGALSEKDGALWFNAAAHGDEKDRVVRRANGELTYFAADIAYHADKFSRPRPPGFAYRLLTVLGADHHGYVPRLRAVVRALGRPAEMMETRIIQLVALAENGVRQKMSTRAGMFAPLRDVVRDIGGDVARYFYVSRKNDQHLDFDLAVAKAQSNDNPVFYIKYAHARVCAVFRNWGGDPAEAAKARTDSLADDAAALRLCEKLADYPDAAERAAAERAPHLLAAHLRELAASLHGYYESARILPPDGGDKNAEEVKARLALLAATRTTLANGMKLLGVTLPEKMPEKT